MWALTVLVVFSIAKNKLPGYILPMAPPIALLLAKELLQPVSRAYKVAVFIEAGTMVFIGVAFGFYGNTLNMDPHVSGTLIATITFLMAGILSVMALWLRPMFLAFFNTAAILGIVITATTMVFPRFDLTDTMRPWKPALAEFVSDHQTVLMYKPPRWAEYGLQYYRFNRVRAVFSPEDLIHATAGEQRVLCIAEDKTLEELTHLANLDLKVVHTIGNQTAFWAWQTK